jgi:hypothetical protein
VPALQDLAISFVMEKGLHARTIKHRLPPFTCIGSVAKLADLSPTVRASFPVVIALQPYSDADVASIASAQARAQGLALTPGAAALVSRLANGNLRQSASLIQLLRIGASGDVTEQQAADRLSQLGFPIAGQGAGVATGRDPARLSGVEFEHYIGELLARMGFKTEVTRQSGDGGVDVVATLDRPIVGGCYLIQCKRFAPDTLVGAPTVREFYGALVADRRAVKGILITTSDFTAQAREFAATIPIELIGGTELRALIASQSADGPPV